MSLTLDFNVPVRIYSAVSTILIRKVGNSASGISGTESSLNNGCQFFSFLVSSLTESGFKDFRKDYWMKELDTGKNGNENGVDRALTSWLADTKSSSLLWKDSFRSSIWADVAILSDLKGWPECAVRVGSIGCLSSSGNPIRRDSILWPSCITRTGRIL